MFVFVSVLVFNFVFICLCLLCLSGSLSLSLSLSLPIHLSTHLPISRSLDLSTSISAHGTCAIPSIAYRLASQLIEQICLSMFTIMSLDLAFACTTSRLIRAHKPSCVIYKPLSFLLSFNYIAQLTYSTLSANSVK